MCVFLGLAGTLGQHGLQGCVGGGSGSGGACVVEPAYILPGRPVFGVRTCAASTRVWCGDVDAPHLTALQWAGV
jgi:hypothetical protein